jgi:hypothetical protein
MIASQFNLDHRIAELRPSADEQRLARVRNAGSPAARGTRSIGDTIRDAFGSATAAARPTRIAA